MLKKNSTPPAIHFCQPGSVEEKEHRKWLREAIVSAQRNPKHGGSPHPTVKVGAVLVGADGHEIAHGANRFARGLDWKNPDRYLDGERSLWFNCAEQMVVAHALREKAEIEGARLYVTLEPCTVCAGLIVECGIKEVVLPAHAVGDYPHLKPKWRHSVEVGLGKLLEAGVKVTMVEMPPTHAAPESEAEI